MEQRLRCLPNQPVTLANSGQAETIPQAFLSILATSMRHTCRACLDANGGYTSYELC